MNRMSNWPRVLALAAATVLTTAVVVLANTNPTPYIVIGTVTEVVSSNNPNPFLPAGVAVGATVRGTFYFDPDLQDINLDPSVGDYSVAQGTDPSPWMTWEIAGNTNPTPFIVFTAPTGTMTFHLANDQFPINQLGVLSDVFSVNSVGNLASGIDPNPTPYIESIGFTLVDTTPHALSSDALIIPNLSDFTDTESYIIIGCGAVGSGGSCLDSDATDTFKIRALLTSIQQQQTQQVPAASTWGLTFFALLLLVGAKVYFGRRRRIPA